MSALAVTGMHRTGTSMVAKALRLAGLYLGEDADLVEPAPDNPEGFFEHAGFVRLNDDLLEATGGAWDHPPPCGPMAADDPRVAGFRAAACDLVSTLDKGGPWGWKDPRLCLTARFWLDLVPDLRFVVCVRHPLEVALSLKRRNQASYALSLSLWQAYYDAILDSVPLDRVLFTHYDSHFDDGDHELDRIMRFAGLDPGSATTARSARNPSLRHHHLAVTLAEADVAPSTIEVYQRLCEDAGRTAEVDEPSSSSARVDRRTLDLALARGHLEDRDRHIAALRRENAELKEQAAAATERGGDADLEDIRRRLDDLEDGLHVLRYQADNLAGRADAPIVRACRELVRAHVPHGELVLVIAKGDPALLDLFGRPTASFPQGEDGQYLGFALGSGASAIAHLEAQRAHGARFLLVPAQARWWIEDFSDFAEHLALRYQLRAADDRCALLADLRSRRPAPGPWPHAASDVIGRLASRCGREPAILDWTQMHMQSRIHGHNMFVPPDGVQRLPYLDSSIEIVLLDDATYLGEARRVASMAVVSLAGDGDGVPRVEDVDLVTTGTEAGVAARSLVVVEAERPDAAWLARLRESLADETVTELLVAPNQSEIAAAAGDADMVAFVEEGVVPLPECFTAAHTTLRDRDRVAGVAVKLFGVAGSLEAAGACVFADGSWAGVATRSYDVSAPWHDYVRDTCWGPGLTFFSATAVDELDHGSRLPAGAAHAVWSAQLWASGFRVLYQPDAAAVRTVARSGEDDDWAREAIKRSWAPALTSRPQTRPTDERSWRSLVARDDVEAGWR